MQFCYILFSGTRSCLHLRNINNLFPSNSNNSHCCLNSSRLIFHRFSRDYILANHISPIKFLKIKVSFRENYFSGAIFLINILLNLPKTSCKHDQSYAGYRNFCCWRSYCFMWFMDGVFINFKFFLKDAALFHVWLMIVKMWSISVLTVDQS